MHLRLRFVALLLILSYSLLGAAAQENTAVQENTDTHPPDYPGVKIRIPGIFVPPIPNAPFSGTVEVLSKQILPDKSVYQRWTRYQIARNSAGVIHNERRRLVLPDFKGDPKLLNIKIYDPQTHLNSWLDTSTYIAHQSIVQHLRPIPNSTLETAVTPAPPEKLITQDLGTETVAGVPLRGTRKQRIVPANISGTGQEVTITDDYWYSEELHVYLVLRHNDPRTGEQTIGIVKLDRQDPDPTLFQIPNGYKSVDETPVKPPRP